MGPLSFRYQNPQRNSVMTTPQPPSPPVPERTPSIFADDHDIATDPDTGLCTCRVCHGGEVELEERCIVRLQRELAAMTAERDALQEALDNEQARGIHTCHDDCQRPMCVLRRDLTAAQKDGDALAGALGEALEQLDRLGQVGIKERGLKVLAAHREGKKGGESA